MVNHACNLRCSYCYTGAKFNRSMTWEIGVTALARAFRSLAPDGHLDLGFFGGEPLLESERILEWMAQARTWAAISGRTVGFNLTTNGTVTDRAAWQVMLDEDLELAVSYDGTPEIHDRHRRDAQGRVSAAVVEKTMRQLLECGKEFRVVTVVRPDSLEALPEGLVWLHETGIRRIDLSLDLWAHWSAHDVRRLELFIRRAAELWRQWLPDFSLNWFDARAGDLAGLPANGSPRCGFGRGEIAVAPGGNLYPCERLIGEDRADQPLRLRGHALDGEDFLDYAPAPLTRGKSCAGCALAGGCDTFCRCGNFVRTGDVNHPDGLLCRFNKATARATSQVLARGRIAVPECNPRQRSCYVA